MKVTPIIMILTAFVVFVTFCCSSAYPMNNETIGSVSNEVTDVPTYHIRIHMKEYAICFGALVHKAYIVALKSACLVYVLENNIPMNDISIYAGRKDVTDMNKKVTPKSVKVSSFYDIGVIEVKNAFVKKEAIKLRVFNHLLQPNNNVKIYGFDQMYERGNGKKTIMNVDNMVTVERNKLKSCLQVNDMKAISSINSAITSVDLGSPFVYTNKKGRIRLVGLTYNYRPDCKEANGEVIFEGIELSHQTIAKELEMLSNKEIKFRRRIGQRNESIFL